MFHKRPVRLSQKTLWCLFLSSLFMWSGFGSCTYYERFIISINEGNSLPCIGVLHFSFVIEAAEHGQIPFTSESKTSNFQTGQLFWNETTGRCQIPEGILLKNIPYGGERKITIQAFDSSHNIGQPVSMGTSPRFILEASGSDVQDNITLNLVRGCKRFDEVQGTCGSTISMSIGTLIIRFPSNSQIPTGTQKILFQLPSTKMPEMPEVLRQITLDETTRPPEHIILTDIPPATERTFSIYATKTDPADGSKKRVLKRWVGKYTIVANPQAQTSSKRIIPIVEQP